MVKFYKMKKRLFASVFVVMFFITSLIGVKLVKADDTPKLNIEYAGTNIGQDSVNGTSINGTVGQEIEVKYKVTPQDIPTSSINGSGNKEIVLVLDTSGSMKQGISDNDPTIRIDALKAAAKDFINKFKDLDNVKIGIASYSTNANYNDLSVDLINTKSGNSTLINKIESYTREYYSWGRKYTDYSKIDGGTNTGDGIRYALRMLNNNSNAKKYVILMSDGEPTFYMKKQLSQPKQVWHDGYYTTEKVWHQPYTTLEYKWHYWGGYYSEYVWHSGYYSYEQVWHDGYYSYEDNYEYYTDLDDSNHPQRDGPGDSDDSEQNCLRYASTMAAKIKDAGYLSYEIAYSEGGSADKMKGLAESSGGKYYSAMDTNAIKNVFNEIGNQIKDSYTVDNVKLNFTIPNGLEYTGNTANVTINGNQYTQVLPKIVYRLSSDKTKYTADYFYITFKIKANQIGNYTIPQGTTVTYTGLDGSIKTINITQQIAYNVTKDLPAIEASIDAQSPQSPNPATASKDDITLRYEVHPEAFEFYSKPIYQANQKDVVFVVDTSNAMTSEFGNLMTGLYGKICNESSIQNARYGIVTFNSNVKDDYITGGLTNNLTTLDSVLKSISCSTNDAQRNIGDAMEHAKAIFTNNVNPNSTKYIILIAAGNVQYTDEQVSDIRGGNYKIITVNLGNIKPPSKANDVVTPGDDEPKNNIKDLHYNLTGLQDNGDNVLQKADNNYYINVNYDSITNVTDPNEYFGKYEYAFQTNSPNNINNCILTRVAGKLKSGVVEKQETSYTFRTKLKFKSQGKFNIVSGLNSNTANDDYDFETPEFDVTYKLNSNGKYVADSVDDKEFKIRIKDNVDINNLKFGPGIVSYAGLSGKALSTNIAPYTLNLNSLQIQSFGLYKGIIDNNPSIVESTDSFKVSQGSSISLGATLTGSLDSNTNFKLDIQKGVLLDGTIKVYTYDSSGKLAQVGTMKQSLSDISKTTYKYDGVEITDKKILIIYGEHLPNDNSNNIYVNSIYTPDNNIKTVKVTGEQLQIGHFGVYKGILNNVPNIEEPNQYLNVVVGSNVSLGATLLGSINNNSDVELEIQDRIILNSDIKVYYYDDNGKLMPIGEMVQVSVPSDSGKKVYKYSGQDVADKKILILYDEHIDNGNQDNVYLNTISTADGNRKSVAIKITYDLPDLF